MQGTVALWNKEVEDRMNLKRDEEIKAVTSMITECGKQNVSANTFINRIGAPA